MAHNVFISYASEDKSTADEVCTALEANGISCWIAPRDIIGGSYSAAIIRAIGSSKLMILILSSHANKSPQVRREVERAVSRGKAIYPLRIENVLPSEDLELFISSEHWMDAWLPPIETHLPQFTKNVRQLLESLAPSSLDEQKEESEPSEIKSPPVTPSKIITPLRIGIVIGALLVIGAAMMFLRSATTYDRAKGNSNAPTNVASNATQNTSNANEVKAPPSKETQAPSSNVTQALPSNETKDEDEDLSLSDSSTQPQSIKYESGIRYLSSSKSIHSLRPDVSRLASQLITLAKEQGIDVIVLKTNVTVEEQDELYAQGRTKPGKVVTKARGGQSNHNFGLAFDIAPYIDGKWDIDGDKYGPAMDKLGEIGKGLGLDWGGEWKHFKDRPHFQLTTKSWGNK